jgi:hypothetical protein
VRQRLVRQWVRGLIAITVVLSLPFVLSSFLRAVGPHRPESVGQAAMQLRRGGGERIVTASGDTLRTVVIRPASRHDATDLARQQGLVWWSRILAMVVALGLLSSTWRTLRQP